MRVVKFNIEHALEVLSNSTEDIGEKLGVDKLELLANSGPTHTWMDDNDIIGCGGIVLMPDETGEAWCLVNNNITFKRKRQLITGAKKFLGDMIKEFKLKYLSACWSDSFDEKINWLKHLGFTKTDEKRTYDGQSCVVYIRRH